jgi:hypothetical protein
MVMVLLCAMVTQMGVYARAAWQEGSVLAGKPTEVRQQALHSACFRGVWGL